MRKGDIAFESLLKVILVLVIITILIGFYTGFIDDVFNWGCDFVEDLIRKLIGERIDLC